MYKPFRTALESLRAAFARAASRHTDLFLEGFQVSDDDLDKFEDGELWDAIHKAHSNPPSGEWQEWHRTEGQEWATGRANNMASIEYKEPARLPWPEGELRPVAGHVGPFVDNHLAHYKGWTILVARDEEDNDWSSQSVPGLHRSLGAYHSSGKSGEFLLAGQWYETKEAALQCIMNLIDQESSGDSSANTQ